MHLSQKLTRFLHMFYHFAECYHMETFLLWKIKEIRSNDISYPGTLSFKNYSRIKINAVILNSKLLILVT